MAPLFGPEDPEELRHEVRKRVWADLRRVARPDSRFHWNFNEFIPDFEGSDRCARMLRAMDIYRRARVVFVTPDNALRQVRELCIVDGKDLLVSSYAIARGFLRIQPGSVPLGKAQFAATLDGLDYVASPVSLAEIEGLRRVDLLVTGASAISREGVRFGKGHGYFDLEWAMLNELGVVDPATPVVGVVHDCQVVDGELPSRATDTVVDYIVTPGGVLRPLTNGRKPVGIDWDGLTPELLEVIPPLAELAARRRPGGPHQ